MRIAAYLLILFFIGTITGCADNSLDAKTEEVSNKGTLVYSVDQYDNLPPVESMVQVTYRDLEDDLIIDSVEVPWEKTFEYSYSTSPDSLRDFTANLVVEYEGKNNTFLIAKIRADSISRQVLLGDSFIINLKNTFKLPL